LRACGKRSLNEQFWIALEKVVGYLGPVFSFGKWSHKKLKVTRLGFKISRGVNPLTSWNKTLAKAILQGCRPS
jgi:hypothetical protein